METAEPTPLREPRDGLPEVVADAAALRRTVESLVAGTGPLAVDAERASGYRYGQRAYLVQLRRAGAGTALIDPLGCPDLSAITEALADAEWILHAASQDLPCLAEVGMVPGVLFDTELAARLAGLERVGLGALCERLLGITLEKGHSAADWSTRPLPRSWLVYAALDVELLVDLRDALAAELAAQGKAEWAREEFQAVLDAGPREPRHEPWRRVGGIHKVRGPRRLAAVRALWEARELVAQRKDVAPGRVLPDAAIVEAVLRGPSSVDELLLVPGFGGPRMRRTAPTWFAALQDAAHLQDADLPAAAAQLDGPPPANRWAEKDPTAAARLARCRAALSAVAASVQMPPENVLEPAALRRVVWNPPEEPTSDAVTDALLSAGARRWQVGLVASQLAEALVEEDLGHA